MYEIRLTDSFRKKALKFFKKHPKLKERYKKSLLLLQVDPFNDVLNIAKMSGKKNIYRLRLTIHARMVMEIIISDKTITPIDINTRANIY
jgi:mRNA-degrading endonuclease RelE of RelBE toxin-antitoxin system